MNVLLLIIIAIVLIASFAYFMLWGSLVQDEIYGKITFDTPRGYSPADWEAMMSVSRKLLDEEMEKLMDEMVYNIIVNKKEEV